MSDLDIWKKYSKIKIIGLGDYSKVYKGKNKETGKDVAIKEIEIIKFKINRKDLKMEIEKIKQIKSENIVEIKELIDNKNMYYIIMELYSYNLENYLLNKNKPLSINEIREILIQLNYSLSNFYNEKIINGNIKASNILIDSNEMNEILSIKLSYFNLMKFIRISEFSLSSEKKVILSTAPEILNGKSFNIKSEIWSLGIIIYYMLNNKYPYLGNTEYNLYQNIISNPNIEINSENEKLNDLLKGMLKVNENERISLNEYFNHPFFNISNLNYIICEYDIMEKELNKPIQILNCLDEKKRKF